MLMFVTGLVLFFGMHSISIVTPGWRERFVARKGELPFRYAYSIISVAGFLLIALGYDHIRQYLEPVVLYSPPIWLRHLSLLLMLPVFVLMIAAYLPGSIQRAAKHPMLLAVKLWALAHLLANGTLADVLLFGSFLAWAVADRISLKRRVAPTVPSLPVSPWNDWIALGAGFGLYVAFVLWLHLALIGVSPMA
ncbi:MAG: NnrU family protein [Thiohalocapsa sp.]